MPLSLVRSDGGECPYRHHHRHASATYFCEAFWTETALKQSLSVACESSAEVTKSSSQVPVEESAGGGRCYAQRASVDAHNKARYERGEIGSRRLLYETGQVSARQHVLQECVVQG